MKQDDKLFLEALEVLLEKERKELVKELKEELKSVGLNLTSGTEKSKVIDSPKRISQVEIDESIVVTPQDIQGVEKNFDSLTEPKLTADKEAKASVNKLKAMKKKDK